LVIADRLPLSFFSPLPYRDAMGERVG
jgi:hypothetical protein